MTKPVHIKQAPSGIWILIGWDIPESYRWTNATPDDLQAINEAGSFGEKFADSEAARRGVVRRIYRTREELETWCRENGVETVSLEDAMNA